MIMRIVIIRIIIVIIIQINYKYLIKGTGTSCRGRRANAGPAACNLITHVAYPHHYTITYYNMVYYTVI